MVSSRVSCDVIQKPSESLGVWLSVRKENPICDHLSTFSIRNPESERWTASREICNPFHANVVKSPDPVSVIISVQSVSVQSQMQVKPRSVHGFHRFRKCLLSECRQKVWRQEICWAKLAVRNRARWAFESQNATLIYIPSSHLDVRMRSWFIFLVRKVGRQKPEKFAILSTQTWLNRQIQFQCLFQFSLFPSSFKCKSNPVRFAAFIGFASACCQKVVRRSGVMRSVEQSWPSETELVEHLSVRMRRWFIFLVRIYTSECEADLYS